ncbi:MAG: sulfotransferase family protein [Alphaproteobacteria bacterium]|nr:sulfotransferase family protein [Alphaproteobacteria bacterium]
MTMPSLRVVGAGLPRTGTSSLRRAFQKLLGAPCLHMSAISTHPFTLGAPWDAALGGRPVDWATVAAQGYCAAVDWPASMFWRELAAANPDAPVLLSLRESPEVWLKSFTEMILPHIRASAAPDWTEGRDLVRLAERFTGTATAWDDPQVLMDAYARHNEAVRRETLPGRLLEWRAEEGWAPLCRMLGGLPVPPEDFPHVDGRGRR